MTYITYYSIIAIIFLLKIDEIGCQKFYYFHKFIITLLSYCYRHYSYYVNCCRILCGFDNIPVNSRLLQTIIDRAFQTRKTNTFDAMDYRKINHRNAGKLGNYPILSVQPDKIARFLFEYPAHRLESLDLRNRKQK